MTVQMVRLEAGFSLFSVVGGDDVHGICTDKGNDQFIFTSSRTVAVFKTPDSKPVQSWSTKASSPFTCTSVYNPSCDEYVAVVNNKLLYKWTSEMSDPFKAKPMSLKTPIFSMLPVAKQPPLLLLSSGTLRSLNDARTKPKEMRDGHLKIGEEITDAWMWPRVEQARPSSYCVCLVKKTKNDTQSLLLLPAPKDEDASDDDAVRIGLESPSSDAKLLSASVSHCGSTAVLYTLWSGGKLCCTSLSEVQIRGSKDGQRLQCVVKVIIPGADDRLKIAALDESHVAVVGLQKVSPSKEAEATLAIWDTTYGTLQAHKTLLLGEEDDGIPSYVGVAHGYLLVATTKAVTLHRYECSEGTLAASLGRLADHVDQDQDLPVIGLKWTGSEGTKSKKQKADSDADREIRAESNTSAVLQNILHSTNTKTVQQFTAAVNKFLRESKPSPPDSTAVSLILRNVVRRVQENPKFWSTSALHNITVTGVIAASSCPEFLALLARKQEASLLIDCLSYMHDIPELTLVQCLQVFLSVEEDKLPVNVRTGSKPEEIPEKASSSSEETLLSEERRACVNKVLTKPFTDSFLLDAVKHLQFKEVLLLLRYLHFLMTNFPPATEETMMEITMDNVVDWIGIILDAHFAQLVLVPEVRPLLSELQEGVKSQVEFSAELSSIRSLLHHANTAKSPVYSASSTATQSYSIEVLRF